AGSLEFFNEKRTDILIAGDNRSIPPYFGATPPTANLGKVRTKGYELELRVNKTFKNNLRVWGNFNMTHAENKVLEYDDSQFLPNYQKTGGYAIGQDHSYLDNGYANTWDELIGTTEHNTNNGQKLPGQNIIIDFNGDGVIDTNDNAPYGFTGTPQNTYNAIVGFEWKGFSAFVQFYGVTNVNRYVGFTSLNGKLNTVFTQDTYWTKDYTNASASMPRWNTTPSYYEGERYHYDGSYIRLKNAEIAYTFTDGWIKRIGLSNLKIYFNGNNLWVWTRMPDDRESNFAGTGLASQGAYPTLRRFNLGIKFNL
ncbi:SusC/RagA family TonB-linked outer membrane protein, partial [Bacteroides sp. OttesenSCG-928-J23]|nr:SusC/RagA family TonB-linked outer membrane protein [Bacteroides sp. OttesenSCG-928-J23]